MPFEHLHGNYLLTAGNAVWDDGIARFVKDSSDVINTWLDDVDQMHCIPQFIDRFRSWVSESRNNRFTGLEYFPHAFSTLGVTQALDTFHYWTKANDLRLRMLPGEYPYNIDVIAGFDRDRDWIGADPLQKGDAAIISVPFSATGNKPTDLETILNDCDRLGIPVLIDAAWFGTCGGINVDLSHPAIQTVAFSTSKGLNCGNWRAGVAFSRIDYPVLRVQNSWNHSVHFNNRMGLLLLDNFNPDYIYDRYREAQIKTCSVYGLTPSCSIHIGLGDDQWSFFSRGGSHYRVNLRRAVKDMFKYNEVKI